MRIVEVIPSLAKRAGAEVFLLNLCRELCRTNEVIVVCLYNEIDSEIQSVFEEYGIKVYFCNKKVGIDFKCGRNFKKIISKIRPDVLHMHLNCITTYFLAFGFSKQFFKSFLTVHSLVEKDFKRVEKHLIKKYLKKKYLTLIGISKLITENIALNFHCGKVVTINNGTHLFDPVDIEQDTDTINIVCVAAFRPEKNQYLLISSFLKSQTDFKQKTKLFFVGDGPLLPSIREMTTKLNLKNIFFFGQQNDIYPFLKESHIFCLSSKYEGNPISIIESISVGLPVVAPNTGGIPDVIKDRINGLLFNVDDENDLSKKLIEMVNNKELRVSIRQNNIKISQQYSIEICSKLYIDLFTKERKK